MRFFGEQVETPADIKAQVEAYYDYLQSVKDRLSPDAFSFASADWHYDPTDHRCPHDSWVESLTLAEPSSGNRHESRKVELKLRLLGAYHDGHSEILYSEVSGYHLRMPELHRGQGSPVGHGDWLVDEIRLSERGLVEHEIRFSQGSSWLIECENIIYKWMPFKES